MAIWDFWTSKSVEYTHGFLKPEQVPAELDLGTLQANATYLSVWLRRMRIENVRVGWKKFHAAVHSEVGALHASGAPTVFRSVISPPQMRDVDPKTLNRVILTNQPLFGPLPYRGHGVRLNAALLAVQVADLSGPFLDVLTDLAGAAGVSYVAVAKPFLEPLNKGIDLLLGVSGSQGLEIYLVTNITQPRTGVYVVLRAPASEVPLDSLKLNPDYTLTSSRKSDLSRYPYLVLTLEARPDREDWRGIPEIGKAYELFRSALQADRPDDIESSFQFLRRTVLLSDDLHESHADKIVEKAIKLREKFDGASLTAAEAIDVPGIDVLDPFEGPA
ncbi:MAG: hypothetical protein J5I93_25900 [Pirellulaceae bacterium]|nr:hypothetical protein [Pirellulaceae bacterium]